MFFGRIFKLVILIQILIACSTPAPPTHELDKEPRAGTGPAYTSEPSIFGKEHFEPNLLISEFSMKPIVSNPEMRRLLGGKIVSLGSSAAIGNHSEVYFLGAHYKVVDQNQLQQFSKSLSDRALFPYNKMRLAESNPIFRWDEKRGLSLYAQDLQVYIPRFILINTVERKNCPIGSPLVFGILRHEMVYSGIDDIKKMSSVTVGPAVGAGQCYLEDEKVVDAIEFSDPKFIDVGSGVYRNQLMITKFSHLNNPFSKNRKSMVRFSSGTEFTFEAIDKENTVKQKIRIQYSQNQPKLVPSDRVEFLPGSDHFFGLHLQSQTLLFCFKHTQQKGSTHKCIRPGGIVERVTSFMVSVVRPNTLIVGTSASLDRNTNQIDSGKLYQVSFETTQEPPYIKIKKSEVIVEAFHNVSIVMDSPAGTLVFDSVYRSEIGNNIYRITPRL